MVQAVTQQVVIPHLETAVVDVQRSDAAHRAVEESTDPDGAGPALPQFWGELGRIL
jgi:hypothetical protein